MSTSTAILAVGGILGGIALFFVSFGLAHSRDKCCGNQNTKIKDQPKDDESTPVKETTALDQV